MKRVLKFGGSTFPAIEAYAAIAAFLQGELIAPEDRLVVVVSAMAGLTERLRGLSGKLTSSASPEAMDGLLPLADTLSAAFLRLAVEGRGVTVNLLAGWQIGLRSDDNFNRARLVAVDAGPLLESLKHHRIVIVPGGQAVDDYGRPTMLGKNSSDLTAIVIAAALGLSECEIFSDVCGIYTGDPNLLDRVQLIRDIAFDSVIDMSRSGAKVLHHGAVGYARDHGIDILCRLNKDDFRRGTRVGGAGGEHALARAVVLDSRAQSLVLARRGDAAAAITALHGAGVPVIDIAGTSELAVTCGFFDPVAFLARCGIAALVWPVWLVSIFDGQHDVVRRVLGPEEAVTFAQASLDRLYPQSAIASASRSRQRTEPAEISLAGAIV